MAKFKVGDKVVANAKASNEFGYTKKGWQGTVEKIIRVAEDCETILDAVFGGSDHVTYRVRGEIYGRSVPFYFFEDQMQKCFDVCEDMHGVKRIIRSGETMVVIWEDDEKTIVRRSPDEPDSDYAAFTAAYCIREFGSNTRLKRFLDKHIQRQEKRQKTEKLPDDVIGGIMDKIAEAADSVRAECRQFLDKLDGGTEAD